MEVLFGKEPNYNDMYAFGTDVYILTPDKKRRKLDDKAVKGIYVGHDEMSKGYRIANPETYKISRDVRFLKREVLNKQTPNSIDFDSKAVKDEPEVFDEPSEDESEWTDDDEE